MSPDPSHIVTEFMEAVEELHVPVYLADDELHDDDPYGEEEDER